MVVVAVLVLIALVALLWFAMSASKTTQPAAHGSGTLTWKTVGES